MQLQAPHCATPRCIVCLLWLFVIASLDSSSWALIPAPCAPDCKYYFASTSGRNVSSVDLTTWDTSSVTNMEGLFSGASTFNQAIGGWNVSAVTDMSAMFFRAELFNQPIDGWNVSSVTDMSNMFSFASSFNQSISSWNVRSVRNMQQMFAYYAFNPTIENWDVSSVTDMSGMFKSTSRFNRPIGLWNVSAVRNLNDMFTLTSAFNQPLDSWNLSSATSMVKMFQGAFVFNQPIGSWYVGSVADMSSMFQDTRVFNQPLGSWDVGAVTSMSSMFQSAAAFNQSLGSWNVSNVLLMSSMFLDATAFRQNLSSWCPLRVQSRAFFGNASMIVLPPWGVTSCGPTTLATPQASSLQPSAAAVTSPSQVSPAEQPGGGTPAGSSMTPSDTASQAASTQGGIIAGVIVAVIVIVAIIVALFIFFRRRRNSHWPPPDQMRSTTPTATEMSTRKARSRSTLNITFSDLQFGKTLGTGSYGAVYEGVYQGSAVAIKQLSNISSAVAGQFFRESNLMLTLPKHPNLVQILGMCQQTNSFAIVMELVPAGSLRTVLNTDRVFSKKETRNICFGVAKGMAALAAHRVVHRDLAARNILLTDALEPKISDFGFSRVVGEAGVGKTATDVGPVRWMSPESLKDSTFSEKSDVWSYGCLLIEIFTKNPPFPDLAIFDVAVAVRDGTRSPQVPRDSTCPEWAQLLIESCFRRDPAARPTFDSIVQAFQTDSFTTL